MKSAHRVPELLLGPGHDLPQVLPPGVNEGTVVGGQMSLAQDARRRRGNQYAHQSPVIGQAELLREELGERLAMRLVGFSSDVEVDLGKYVSIASGISGNHAGILRPRGAEVTGVRRDLRGQRTIDSQNAGSNVPPNARASSTRMRTPMAVSGLARIWDAA